MSNGRTLISVVGGVAIGLGIDGAMCFALSRWGAWGWLALPIVLVLAVLALLLVLFLPLLIEERVNSRRSQKNWQFKEK